MQFSLQTENNFLLFHGIIKCLGFDRLCKECGITEFSCDGLNLSENAKVDVYAFLFDDMLLLTRFRKLPQKVNKVSNNSS